jgi:hypothetical protein
MSRICGFLLRVLGSGSGLPSALFNTALTQTRRKSPHTKPNAAGIRERNRSMTLKKSSRSLIE